MSTEERREEVNAGMPGVPVTADGQATLPQEKVEFEPHKVIDLEGTLACAQELPRSAAALAALCLPALTEQVEQASIWNLGSTEPEGRLGDYRFLIMEFTDAADICRYVQIWSEPHCHLAMEVGPGNRKDATLQSIADAMSPALTGRGFEIGGNASNFRKRLVAPSTDGAGCIANEMFAILTDVHGYDGTSDLTYRLHQGTRLEPSHVLEGISRSQLCDWLTVWDLHPRRNEDHDDVLSARDRDLHFTVMLRVPKRKPSDDFWEIHCYTTFSLPNDAAAELLADYNSRPGLIRIFEGSGGDQSTREIGVVTGINLAGGVTPSHIRCQIREWLDAAKSLRQHRARQPEPMPSGAEAPVLN